eukprot:940041-Rhodomonas_salina.1
MTAQHASNKAAAAAFGCRRSGRSPLPHPGGSSVPAPVPPTAGVDTHHHHHHRHQSYPSAPDIA